MDPRLLPKPSTKSFLTAQTESTAATKEPFVAPKLTFVKPTLMRQGSVESITADGFFEITPLISPGG